MAKLKHVGVFFLAKLHATILGIVGLILGILYSFGGFVYDLLVTMSLITSAETPGLSYGTVLAFGALIGMPLIGITVGLVTGAIGAILYNLVIGRFGGIELDVKK